jgi:putative chitinase
LACRLTAQCAHTGAGEGTAMIAVDGEVLRAVAPKFIGVLAEAQARIIGAIEGVIRGTLEEYEISTRLRVAHFLAQIIHEAAGLRTTEEFASGAAYEGRKDLGNVNPGDGRRYKGRGLLQLTGRANYKRLGEKLGINLVDEPTLAAEPKLSLKIACEYWTDRKINAACDADDLIAVTKKVNGGLNGLADRRQLLVKAKAALARVEGIVVASSAPSRSRPTLHRGSQGEAVGELQTLLRDLGFQVAVDQDFGAATELAVMSVQSNAKLKADGIVGSMTWRELDNAAQAKAA